MSASDVSYEDEKAFDKPNLNNAIVRLCEARKDCLVVKFTTFMPLAISFHLPEDIAKLIAFLKTEGMKT